MKVFSKFILILFVFSFNSISAQQINEKDYLLMSFERVQNKQHKEKDVFYWIIPVKNQETKSTFSPIYFEGYSKTKLEKCIKNETVYIFNTISGDEYDFSIEYKEMVSETLKLIEANKYKFLSIKNKWKSGLKETIDVFITPITGSICNCPIPEKNSELINYYGQIYLPVENLRVNNHLLKGVNFYELEKKISLNNFDNTAY